MSTNKRIKCGTNMRIKYGINKRIKCVTNKRTKCGTNNIMKCSTNAGQTRGWKVSKITKSGTNVRAKGLTEQWRHRSKTKTGLLNKLNPMLSIIFNNIFLNISNFPKYHSKETKEKSAFTLVQIWSQGNPLTRCKNSKGLNN